MDDLDRLYHRLREAARQHSPGPEPRSLTIAEVYQQLVPYRAVRTELGLMELARYEHALLRLLAGERGYLEVLVPQARDELLRELHSPNPILGVYRDYAGVEVRLGAEPRSEGAPPPAHSPSPPSPTPRLCRRCREPLPEDAGVRFCPRCGAGQDASACRACATPLRAEWNFCIRCGTPRAAP